jgi:hypothetical protein
MVKSGTERSEKYDAKFDAEVVRSRYTATATLAKARQDLKGQLLAAKAAAVRNIMNQYGIYPIDSVKYHAYSNKLAAICFRMAGFATEPTFSDSARAQALLQATVFKAYGLNANVQYLIWGEYATMLGEAPSPIT